MIRWFRNLFKPEDQREAELRQIYKLAAAELAKEKEREAVSLGYSISKKEIVKLEEKIEYRLRNPGERKGQIPVRVEKLVDDLVVRSGSIIPTPTAS